jgi:hypothetical protein
MEIMNAFEFIVARRFACPVMTRGVILARA